LGDHGGARSELEAAFHHWSRNQRTYSGLDERIMNRVGLARTLWAQGFPVQAVEWAREAFNDAKQSSNRATLAFSWSLIPSIFFWVGDLPGAEEHTNQLIAHVESHPFGPYLHVGHGYRGMLAIFRGDAKAGVEMLQESLKRLRAVSYESRNTEFNVILTRGLIAAGRADEGIALIDATIARAEENCEFYFLPEALRIKGCALLASAESLVDKAEACFIQSLELSRRQGARAWELRAAIDLARLSADRGKSEDGRRLLRPILDQFLEGRETADPQTAERLLAGLERDQ